MPGFDKSLHDIPAPGLIRVVASDWIGGYSCARARPQKLEEGGCEERARTYKLEPYLWVLERTAGVAREHQPGYQQSQRDQVAGGAGVPAKEQHP